MIKITRVGLGSPMRGSTWWGHGTGVGPDPPALQNSNFLKSYYKITKKMPPCNLK